jgi:membrane dipeptidase
VVAGPSADERGAAGRRDLEIATVDGHADVFSKAIEEGLDYFVDAERFQASLPRLRRGGVVLQAASIFVPAAFAGEEALAFARRIVGAAEAACARPETGGLVRDAAGVRAAGAAPAGVPPRFFLAMEGASPLCGSATLLDEFVDRGLRMLGLTHNHDNECGDGCFAKAPQGLTAVGKDLARRAERAGVVLDAAHLNRPALAELLRAAQQPVVYSHGGSRRLCDVPRNLDDDAARAVAATGGVLAVDFFPGHIVPGGAPARLADVVAHLEHWAELLGVDAVAVGGDFDGITTVVSGLEDASTYPALWKAMAERGFTAEEIRKIAAGNWVRVLGAARASDSGSAAAR